MASDAQRKAVQKYNKKRNRITIDFYPAEAYLWEYLNKQEKKQTYIKALILADMEYKRGAYVADYPPRGYQFNEKHELIVDEETMAKVQEALRRYVDRGETEESE